MVVLTYLIQLRQISIRPDELGDLFPYDIGLLLLCRRAVDTPMLIAGKRRIIIAHFPCKKRFAVLSCQLDVPLAKPAQMGTFFSPPEQTANDKILKASCGQLPRFTPLPNGQLIREHDMVFRCINIKNIGKGLIRHVVKMSLARLILCLPAYFLSCDDGTCIRRGMVAHDTRSLSMGGARLHDIFMYFPL